MRKKSLIIGIAGRSCSGKSILAQELVERLGKNNSIHIDIDEFSVNLAEFDCNKPGELESQAISELYSGLFKLKRGQTAEFSVYDFNKKSKLNKPPIKKCPAKFIIIEGAIALWSKEVRDLLDIKVFVDVPDEICLNRRLERALRSSQNRGKDSVSVRENVLKRWKIISNQWDNYLEPTKEYANVIIPHPEKGTAKILDIIKTL